MSRKYTLSSAVKSNNQEKVAELINDGIDINRLIPFEPCSKDVTEHEILHDYRMYSPISIAIECGNTEMLSFLLQSGGDYKVKSTQTTFHSQICKFEPLYQACQLHRYDMVDLILKAGADVNGRAFCVTVMEEEEGGSINYSDCDMRYIDLAVEKRDVELLTVLTNNGVNTSLMLENSHLFLDFMEESLTDFSFLQLLIESGFGSPFASRLADFFSSITQSLLHGWDGNFAAKVQLVKLLHLLGYKAETKTVTGRDNVLCETSTSCKNCNDLLSTICDLQKHPRRLNDSCRIVIRNQLSSINFRTNLRKLPLPNILLDYLMMKDFF